MREHTASGSPELTFISRDELQAVVGGRVDAEKLVEAGYLPVEAGYLPRGNVSANAVARWAMEQAYCCVGPYSVLAAERRELDGDTPDRGPYGDVLREAMRWVVWVRYYGDLTLRALYTDGGGSPEWVEECRPGVMRWWRYERLAAGLVAYAPKLKADLESYIELYGPLLDHDSPSERQSADRRARALVHLYLVDVVALIASKLPETKAAAV